MDQFFGQKSERWWFKIILISAGHHVVSLDKKIYFILCLLTQVYRLWVKLSNALGNGPEPHPVEEGVVILLQCWTKVDTSSD